MLSHSEKNAAIHAHEREISRRGKGMSDKMLSDFVEATATKFAIPGVAVGVWIDGQATYACHGVTSIDNPLPINQDTLFILGSVTKSYTATALMWLGAAGRVEVGAPARRSVPQLVLSPEQAAAGLPILDPLHPTSGPGWGGVAG